MTHHLATRYLNPAHLWRKRDRVPVKAGLLLRQALGAAGIGLLENERRLASLRGIHDGKQAFVIGNGPSLRVSDLDAIRGEISFASNKIYLAFPETAWRPNYYFVSDRLVAINNKETISALPLQKFYSRELSGLLPSQPGALWFDELPGNTGCVAGDPRYPGMQDRDGRRVGYFSKNALTGFYSGQSVVYPMLQMAFFMGITKLYLMGIDFSFNVPATTVRTGLGGGYEVAVKSSGEVNHFHPDYRKPGELWSVPTEDAMKTQSLAFAGARAAFEGAGREIWNVSRQTKLDAIQRRPLDDVLASIGRKAADRDTAR